MSLECIAATLTLTALPMESLNLVVLAVHPFCNQRRFVLNWSYERRALCGYVRQSALWDSLRGRGVSSRVAGSALRLSAIVPTACVGADLRHCLDAIRAASPPPDELIVVVDGISQDAQSLAGAYDARVVATSRRGGPGRARNVGAGLASGDLLFFVDSDVVIAPDAVSQVVSAFTIEPELAAVFGSYDDAPAQMGFLSQYKNLLHHYVHQNSSPDASTFWAGCGAIRRGVFLALGGFDERYSQPSIEDIELGYRLRAAGYSIRLLKSLQAKHLKRWTVRSLLASDFAARALPWSELILRRRAFVNDLNLTIASRTSVVLAYVLVAALLGALVWTPSIWLAALSAAALLALNVDLYGFFARKRGLLFALAAIPWHWLYYLYSGLAFALAAATMLKSGAAPRRGVAPGPSPDVAAQHSSAPEEDPSVW